MNELNRPINTVKNNIKLVKGTGTELNSDSAYRGNKTVRTKNIEFPTEKQRATAKRTIVLHKADYI